MNEQEIARRVALARDYFSKGRCNCAQSVAMAFSDLMGLDVSLVESLSAGFGAGFARQREVCGALSGGTLALGAICSARGVSDVKSKALSLAGGLCESARAKNGAIVCRELLAIRTKKSPKPNEISPEEWEIQQNRSCLDYVSYAAEQVATIVSNL